MTAGAYLTGGLAPVATVGPTRLQRLEVLTDTAARYAEEAADRPGADPIVTDLAALFAQLSAEVTGLARSVTP